MGKVHKRWRNHSYSKGVQWRWIRTVRQPAIQWRAMYREPYSATLWTHGGEMSMPGGPRQNTIAAVDDAVDREADYWWFEEERERHELEDSERALSWWGPGGP